MLFFNKYSYVNKIVKTFLKNVDDFSTSDISSHLSLKEYIYEYRKLELKTPRQSGKSSVIHKYFNQNKDIFIGNKLYFHKNFKNNKSIYSFNYFPGISKELRGNIYSTVWIEDPPTELVYRKIIDNLCDNGSINEKTKIIVLGT